MYDRTLLRAIATDRGALNPRQMAAALNINVSAAYRLWRGTHAPSGPTAAAVQAEYGLTYAQLTKPATAPAGAAA